MITSLLGNCNSGVNLRKRERERIKKGEKENNHFAMLQEKKLSIEMVFF